MHQNACELENVEVADWGLRQTRDRPHPSCTHFENVMNVSGNTPPVWVDEQARVALLVWCLILCDDELGFFAPNCHIAIFFSDVPSLRINIIININADDPDCENGAQDANAGIEFWVEGQVSAVNCINRRNPHKAAPAEVEASAVLHDVDGLVVATFPPEEFGYINEL